MKHRVFPLRRAQSLIEVIVAVSLLAAFVAAFYPLAVGGRITGTAREYTVAVLLANQAMEATRSIASRGYGNLTDGSHGLVEGTQYAFHPTAPSDFIGNMYTRSITVADACLNGSTLVPVDATCVTPLGWAKFVTVSVQWTGAAVTIPRSIFLKSIFSNRQ